MRSVALGLLALALAACVPQQMEKQAKYQPFGEASRYPDGAMMRPLVPGTVPYGRQRRYAVDPLAKAAAGASEGATPVAFDAPPPTVDLALLESGRSRYQTFCAPCHGALGAGDGVVVQHGFPAPGTLHTERLRQAPEGHLYAVISQGYGKMYAFASRLTPAERWAVVAYIRALQLSQHGSLAEVPAGDRPTLTREAPP